jgi:sialic acid synthase SpsE
MVREIRLTEKMLGKVNYEITPSSMKNMSGRRSIYVSNSIKKGEKFTESNVRTIRPSHGLHPKHYKSLLGREASCDLSLGDRLSWSKIK